jgi:hypothetical protein
VLKKASRLLSKTVQYCLFAKKNKWRALDEVELSAWIYKMLLGRSVLFLQCTLKPENTVHNNVISTYFGHTSKLKYCLDEVYCSYAAPHLPMAFVLKRKNTRSGFIICGLGRTVLFFFDNGFRPKKEKHLLAFANAAWTKFNVPTPSRKFAKL